MYSYIKRLKYNNIRDEKKKILIITGAQDNHLSS